MGNKRQSGAKRKLARSSNLFAQIDEITHKERELAKKRQARAGITPVKTGFKRASELPPEINAALDKIWAAGSLGDGKTDHVLRLLYAQISRGISCLTTSDVLVFAKLAPAEMRAIAFWLVRGRTLKDAMWAADQQGE